jgi:hypothetical protein
MSIPETLGVFVGIPAGIILLITIGVYGRSLMHQPNRYRPGRPWPFVASWFVPHPDAISKTPVPDGSSKTTTTAIGGASGEW